MKHRTCSELSPAVIRRLLAHYILLTELYNLAAVNTVYMVISHTELYNLAAVNTVYMVISHSELYNLAAVNTVYMVVSHLSLRSRHLSRPADHPAAPFPMTVDRQESTNPMAISTPRVR